MMPVTVTDPRKPMPTKAKSRNMAISMTISMTRAIHTITDTRTAILMGIRTVILTAISTTTITDHYQGNTSPVCAKNIPLCLRSY